MQRPALPTRAHLLQGCKRLVSSPPQLAACTTLQLLLQLLVVSLQQCQLTLRVCSTHAGHSTFEGVEVRP